MRALAATSTPMKPPPSTATWPLPRSSRAPTACESSIVRIVSAPSSGRGVDPVASASRPNSIRSPPTSMAWPATSTAVTSAPRRSSTSCSRHQSAGCMASSSTGFSPRRNSLVSGGRW